VLTVVNSARLDLRTATVWNHAAVGKVQFWRPWHAQRMF